MELEGGSAQPLGDTDPPVPGQMMGWTRASDVDLVARLKAGDPQAFEEALARYQVKIYSLARGLTHNDEDAQDVLQDTFLCIFKSIKSFKGDSSLSTWIYRVTVNAALMQMRKRRKEGQTVSIEDYLPRFDDDGHRVAVVPDWHPLVDQLLMNKELGGLLRDWIAALHPDYRTVFVMRDQEEMSNEEVARVLGLTVAAVKSRLHRARLYLRERAKRYVYSSGRGRAIPAAER
jgi:RNA polymerase sigma-70 factor, ECF subfamily